MAASPYPQIIRLARSSSLERAWALMEQHGLLDSETDRRALTLQARLVKDRAKRAEGAERAQLFGASAAFYAKAGAIDRGSYPLINAASLSLLAGQKAQSEKLAHEVLAALDANPDEAETPYWLGATRAEALLLLGQQTEARAALRQAIEKQPAAWEDHAATIGQFTMLCEELGFDAGWIEALRPPRSLHFAGIMNVAQDDPTVQTQIAQWLERENIGFGFGALAAGSDIWIAEALLDRGAQLHMVLPCAIDVFRQRSVADFGEGWLPRFDAVIAQAEEVDTLEFAVNPDGPAVTRAEATACGMARHRAQTVQSFAKGLRIAGQQDAASESLCADTHVIHAERLNAGSHTPLQRGMGTSFAVQNSDGTTSYGKSSDAIEALLRSSQSAAIDYLPIENDDLPQQAKSRLLAMLECAEEGQICATREAAFSLLADNPSLRIEDLGEMRWAGGRMPLFSVAR